ncbi:neurotrypsin-like [Amphiura filiformis]|uniref:neurotrypsin-like n=1 Tax=Amphiura filiformis TaxID=82378 RepID=UPI003B22397E
MSASAYKEVRLSGGTSPFEGRVEILHNGEWGTVCDTKWGMNDAKVVCSQLGYQLHTLADTSLEFGPGNYSSQIWMDRVECNGNEYSLDECDAKWSDTEPIECIDHYNDAGVICSPFEEGAIRLFGGDSRFEGGVEMYYRGKWGTVCDHGWSGNDAKVACRQLGYPKARYAVLNARQYYGSIRYDYIVEDLGCDGYESKLIDCWPIDFTPGYCDSYDLAGLVCYETVPVDEEGLSPEAIAGIVVASIFASLFMLCCCAAVCSSNNRKRSTRTPSQ